MRVVEVDLDPDLVRQLGMERHLLPLVIAQRLTQGRGNSVELTRLPIQGGVGGGIVHLRQQHRA